MKNWIIVNVDGSGHLFNFSENPHDVDSLAFYKMISNHHKYVEIISEKGKVIKLPLTAVSDVNTILMRGLNFTNPDEYEDMVVDVNLS